MFYSYEYLSMRLTNIFNAFALKINFNKKIFTFWTLLVLYHFTHLERWRNNDLSLRHDSYFFESSSNCEKWAWNSELTTLASAKKKNLNIFPIFTFFSVFLSSDRICTHLNLCVRVSYTIAKKNTCEYEFFLCDERITTKSLKQSPQNSLNSWVAFHYHRRYRVRCVCEREKRGSYNK